MASVALGRQVADVAQHGFALVGQQKVGSLLGFSCKGDDLHLGFLGNLFSEAYQFTLYFGKNHRPSILSPDHRGRGIYQKHVPSFSKCNSDQQEQT
nr:hypothetical protein [Meiothermus rufus]